MSAEVDSSVETVVLRTTAIKYADCVSWTVFAMASSPSEKASMNLYDFRNKSAIIAM